jgi:hypothetical protein
MKKAATVLTTLLFLLPLVLFAQDEGYYDYSYARLSYVKGDVVVQRAGDLGSEEGVVNLALVEGDKLETRDGRAEVYFGRKDYLRLDRNTQVEFANLPREGDNRVRLHLLSGNIYLRVGYLEEEKSLEVHTPDASFYVLEPGLYRLDLRGDGQSELTVLEGSVEAAGEGGSELVSGRTRLLASNGHLGSQAMLSYNRDDFDYWNENRDSLQNQYVSKRYLSSELEDYEYELASNGRWAYERPYGYVWIPTVYYPDWRPYYYGRWLWYPSCGWTWISYESWGWCTYHYGRWHWRLGLGWYWIPTHRWGPGWVHWYNGYDYVGWSPLSWYNRPVVIVNNYFYDRYHGDHYPAGSRALTVVHRNQLQSPRIAQVALSRAQAAGLGRITLQSRQPDVTPVVGRAGLRASSPARISSPPQIRPSQKNLSAPARTVPSGLGKSSALGNGRTAPARTPAASSSTLSPRGRTGSGRVVGYPSSRSASSALRRSGGAASSVSSGAGRSSPSAEKARGSSLRSGIKSYSPSARISPSESGPSPQRRESRRIYSPTSSISRFGSSGLLSPREAFSGRESRPNLSQPRTSPSFRQGETFPRGNSFSSRPKSVFSAPRAPSFSRSPRTSAPSFSRSGPSRSSSSGRPSAPRSSSSSRSSSGRPVKKGG